MTSAGSEIQIILSAAACQKSGLGSPFQRPTPSRIASTSAGKLEKVPRRSRRRVLSLNHGSTRASPEFEVGMKCRCPAGTARIGEPLSHLRSLRNLQIVQDHVDFEVYRETCRSASRACLEVGPAPLANIPERLWDSRPLKDGVLPFRASPL
jgi:hypothetical protein